MTQSMAIMRSPLGPIRLVANGEALVAVQLLGERETLPPDSGRVTGVRKWIDLAVAQLAEYFAGTRTGFELPLAPLGSSFQRQVWNQLLTIPHGEVRSYGHIANALGRPSASRAVGAANGRNPIAIIVPCHRVIGANGTLTGYAGGLAAKQWLLDHERQRHRHAGGGTAQWSLLAP